VPGATQQCTGGQAQECLAAYSAADSPSSIVRSARCERALHAVRTLGCARPRALSSHIQHTAWPDMALSVLLVPVLGVLTEVGGRAPGTARSLTWLGQGLDIALGFAQGLSDAAGARAAGRARGVRARGPRGRRPEAGAGRRAGRRAAQARPAPRRRGAARAAGRARRRTAAAAAAARCCSSGGAWWWRAWAPTPPGRRSRTTSAPPAPCCTPTCCRCAPAAACVRAEAPASRASGRVLPALCAAGAAPAAFLARC